MRLTQFLDWPPKLLCLGAFFICFFPNTASAVVPQRILGGKQAPDATIASFTKIIESGRLSGPALAQRYWERGKHYGKLGRYENAVADYSAALDIDPGMVKVYIDRAVAYARVEKYQAAYTDFNQAAKLQPGNALVYAHRGTLSFLLGKYRDAAADFERYLGLRPTDMYRMLWLYLSEKYQDRNASSTLSKYADKVDLVQWPGAIVELYSGAVDAAAVIEALSKGVPNMRAGHKCEAYYYLAHYYLLQNDRDKAKALFNKAVATGAKSYLEYEFAVAYSLKLAKP
jgi:lipoprotein NlpI